VKSELVILSVDQPYGNHNGADIKFGPDGMLYLSLGDGGSQGDPKNHAQRRETLLESILRIDVRAASAERPYAIPSDNPFANQQGLRGEIWAYGFRNPWRMSFDRKSGELWTGDVGQNKWEELDIVVKGGATTVGTAWKVGTPIRVAARERAWCRPCSNTTTPVVEGSR
jgi:glucose/arabinose dehydrogenase